VVEGGGGLNAIVAVVSEAVAELAHERLNRDVYINDKSWII